MPTLPAVPKTDYELLMKRMRDSFLEGKTDNAASALLDKEGIWKQLNDAQMLEWSRLAFLVGKKETARDILDFLLQHRPSFKEAWQEYWDICLFLEETQKAVRIRTKAIALFPELQETMHLTSLRKIETSQDDNIYTPFQEERTRQELTLCYMNLFAGRENCFARQWVNKREGTQGYLPVRSPMTEEDLRNHLSGRMTYGIYLLREDSSVKVAAIDSDLKPNYRNRKLTSKEQSVLKRERDYLVQRIREISANQGMEVLTEFSGGKGYHFWYFLQEPMAAAVVRSALLSIAKVIAPDLQCFSLEVFPKQDTLSGKGLGNLIKLPLGVHRKTGKRSYFLPRCSGTVWEQLRVLLSVKPVPPETLHQHRGQHSAPVSLHPQLKAWNTSYPELALLSDKCPALAQVFASCRAGAMPSQREEKVLLWTLGFMTRRNILLEALLRNTPGHNTHLLQYKLSKVRGTPLGCKKIHTLLGLGLDYCQFENVHSYAHPLLHCPQDAVRDAPFSEKVETLQDALDQLRASIDLVCRHLAQQDSTSTLKKS